MSIEKNTIIATRIMEEFLNRNNPAVVDEHFAQDFLNHSPQFNAPPDREGLKQMVALLHRTFPDIRFTAEDQIVTEDRIVIRLRTTGRNTGVFMGMQPTDRKVDFSSISILHLDRNGKVKERWNIADQMEVLHQLGLM